MLCKTNDAGLLLGAIGILEVDFSNIEKLTFFLSIRNYVRYKYTHIYVCVYKQYNDENSDILYPINPSNKCILIKSLQ